MLHAAVCCFQKSRRGYSIVCNDSYAQVQRVLLSMKSQFGSPAMTARGGFSPARTEPGGRGGGLVHFFV